MNKQQAQEIIRNTFESSFDINSFTGFIKNLLNRIDDVPFTYQGNYIPDAYKQYIKTLERIGKFSDGENNIDILVITLQKETSLERARTMQRNFVAWYLNGSRGGEMKDAALAAFVSPGESDWRFSLVKMDYRFEQTPSGKIKVKEEFTPARRWSFLVGANEKSHTAQSRLINILENDEQAPTLQEIENAFDIETVTKEFFLKYRDLFLRTKEELDKVIKKDPKVEADFADKGVDTVNFAKKLLGQIVFLYFLQKKGWFGVGRDDDWGTGSKHFLRELFEKKHSDYKNFFNDILEPLFYEALRSGKDREHIDYYYSRFNCKIPFLNGGLFDPIGNYDWVHTDICLPDKLISNTSKTKEVDIGDGILDIFDRYNFTVKEDEPLEKEVAIDPELLGKAYEKFNAIRPDNFEEYKKALKSGKKGDESKFNRQFGVYYTPREIVHYMCRQSLINYLATELDGLPAEASAQAGKASKEDIETLINIGEHVSENEEIALLKEQSINEGKQKTSDYKLKLPVSIRKNAALIDQKLADINVCDPAVGSGAFPVGMMSEIVKTRAVLTTFIADKANRTSYNFKRRCIEHSLYGVDIDPGAVEIAKLRLWLSLVVDEEDIKNIKPLPNLDYKIVCGNSLLGVEKNLFNNQLFAELERLKPLHFSETNPTKKQEYKKRIDDLISRITNGHTEFDYEVYFSEVFHAKGGFDVVIGNPPYGANIDNMIEVYKKKYYESIRHYADIFKIFFHQGLNICKVKGIETFITPNTYLSQPRYKDLRKYLLKYKFISILNLGQGVFEDVEVPVAVTIIMKSEQKSRYHFCDLSINSTFGGALDKVIYKEIEQVNILTSPDMNMLSIYDFKEDEVPLDNVLSIKDGGIQYHRSGIGLKKKGGSDLYSRIFSDDKHRFKNYQPTWYGKLIDRYYIRKETDEFFNLDYKKVLKNNETVSFSRDAFQQKEKLLWRQTASCIKATLDEEKRWFRNTLQCAWIKDQYLRQLDIKYVLAILNSMYLRWVYNKIVNETGRVFPQVKITHVKKLPIRLISSKEQKPFVVIVDKILAITKDNDYLQNSQKQAKVKTLEQEVDRLVYELYGLTDEEITLVEGNVE